MCVQIGRQKDRERERERKKERKIDRLSDRWRKGGESVGRRELERGKGKWE